mmetsp:Transcript_13318/g.30833  ORF Transcript_13318/g.30833 Transcript_13318/m.30833 type:complete len:385 (+) Transcript_13318:105-1259(+)
MGKGTHQQQQKAVRWADEFATGDPENEDPNVRHSQGINKASETAYEQEHRSYEGAHTALRTDKAEVVFRAPQWEGIRDVMNVMLVAGLLVPVFTVLAPLTVALPVILYRSLGGLAIGVYVSVIALSLSVPGVYSATWKKTYFRPFLREIVSYVRNFRVLKATKLHPDEKYVFCWHPHGRLFFGFAAFSGLFDMWCPELSNREFFGGVNGPLFKVPFLGNLLYLSGLIPCDRRSIDKQLCRGNHVGLIIGGIEEVLEGTFDDRDVLFLRGRKGFCKVAMDQGAGLVPVYCFGENQLFQHEPSWVLSAWKAVNRVLKVGAPLPIRGWCGLPVPYRRELVIAMGKPLFAAEGETVDEFHARYVTAVQELYDEHVGGTEGSGRPLVLV